MNYLSQDELIDLISEERKDSELFRAHVNRLVNTDDKNWSYFNVGDKIDCKDRDKTSKWYKSVILEKKEKMILVHYYGWSPRWDEWLHIENNIRRLAPENTYTHFQQESCLITYQLDDDMCAICLENFRYSEQIWKLSCSHLFHDQCIIPWLENHNSCPCCRRANSVIRRQRQALEYWSSTVK